MVKPKGMYWCRGHHRDDRQWQQSVRGIISIHMGLEDLQMSEISFPVENG